MYKVAVTEFKRNFDKYLVIGQNEKIQVTYKGKPIFTIVPEKSKTLNEWENHFGILPKEALKDETIDRE